MRLIKCFSLLSGMTAGKPSDLAVRHRDIAIAMNRLRFELIQLEEKKNRSLEALQMARMTIDGEVSS